MGETIKIHETAFLTATFRSIDENLSGDPFAKLWQNEKTDLWLKEYINNVSTEEPYCHCLRNRYFLDQIKKSIKQNNIEILINFGSGFSMYPFLLDENLIHIEIDKPEIVEHKKQKIEDWQNKSLIPKRDIHFLGVDFNEEYESELVPKIMSVKKDKRSFILIEGVLFFLGKKETISLFSLFDSLQNKGDLIGSVSFQNNVSETISFKKMLAFLAKKLTKDQELDYQLIDDEFYQNIENYKLTDKQDFFSLSKKYRHATSLSKGEILNETMYLLEKIGSKKI
ncbi:MAG: class I SAM-dependent methyltransferase [Lutibacter sp.]|nr:class I SAM-dependent methyltransferase [Lutibacter sp.]